MCESGYLRNLTTSLCEDVNECLRDKPCRIEQECLNLPGDFECQNIPCEKGYERSGLDGECVGKLQNTMNNF